MKQRYRSTNFENCLITLEGNQGEIGAEYQKRNGIYRYPRHLFHVLPHDSGTVNAYCNRNRNCTSVSCCSTPARYQSQIDTEQLTQTHLDNLRCNLERRLQAAKAKGNTNLVSLLERESNQLALNA